MVVGGHAVSEPNTAATFPWGYVFHLAMNAKSVMVMGGHD